MSVADLMEEAARVADEELTSIEIRAFRNAYPLSGASGDWLVQDVELPATLAHWPTGRLTELGLAVRKHLVEASS
ncbi:MAG TPA: hypothetical protein VFJ46_17710 [Xanthobacteraceae bacterium]|nr:hypothetical protein [Xanthobacteraceae bacterium]